MHLARGRVAHGLRLLIGLSAWAAGAVGVHQLATSRAAGEKGVLDDLREHFSRQPIEFEVRFPTAVLLEVGDAVLPEQNPVTDSEPQSGSPREDARPIGEVSALLDESGQPSGRSFAYVRGARVTLFDRNETAPRADYSVRLVKVPAMAGEWVLRTLITEEKQARVRAIWSERGLLRHRRELIEMGVPILEKIISDCEKTLEEEARPFLNRHRPAISALVYRVERELGNDTLSRLFEEEIWPILRKRLQPVLDAVGAEIWDRLPLWGLTWRAVYQSLPLTADDHFRRRWNRFVEDEVVPILRSRSGDIVNVCRAVAKDTLANPRVGSVLREALLHLSSDPEFHRLSYTFAKEVFLENPRFRARIRDRWESDEARALVDFVAQKLEPVIREIGDIVLGTREEGITPEFARVLRAQILEKDARRIFIALGSDGAAALPAGARLDAVEEEERP